MSFHVVVGAGPVGRGVAKVLAERGARVRVVSRRGGGPELAGVERVRADATDAGSLAEVCSGAAVLYNCANPLYHRWLTDWPPLAAALLTAAERSGAVLAIASNLYGYGPVEGPIDAATPLAATHPKLKLRADMWREAESRHQAGRIRAVEVRSSDYVEANSLLSFAIAKPVRAGKRAFVPCPLDVPHSWTTIADVARTLVTVAGDERAWGKGWLTPTAPPLTVRELSARYASAVGAPTPKLSSIPYPVLWAVGLINPLVRELRATAYQFQRPFIVDSSLTERTFDLAAAPLDAALRAVAT
ncbi:MAG TPA: NAD-dependent epimerase/dehydratase family protein [Polyangia bacterium]|nr:NAD-dependent epimerase/dehydratase family protein [Polyangia bacterium]